TAKLRECALLVNTTPLGMTPNVDACPPVDWSNVNPEAFVYDIIYTPAETRFLREAGEHGHAVVNGEEMLAGQGAEALKLWTGIEPDIKKMQEALRAALA
ncbi:MAG: shikimate dehydrogenase, partial [Selenomonas sp.]|nr:shikimate dehydrogenase [Selenomonas sp.]